MYGGTLTPDVNTAGIQRATEEYNAARKAASRIGVAQAGEAGGNIVARTGGLQMPGASPAPRRDMT